MQKPVLLLICLAAFAAAGEVAVVTPSAIDNLQSTVADGPDAVTIPRLLSYQGKLTDNGGNAVPDTTYSVAFRLYTVPSGGTQFWTETQTVRTKNGLFSVLLGSVTPIGSMPDAGAVYLGMAVAGGAELTPRLRIASAAYAYLTERAANSDLLQGKDTTALDTRYVNEAQANSVTSAMITNGTIAAADLGQMGASTGQVMKWTGSAWAPRNDSVGGGGTLPDSVPGSFAVSTDLRVYGKGRIGLGNSNAGNAAFVAGEGNVASANYSSVSGGADNSATAVHAHISGGGENRAAGDYSTVGGGGMNYASGGRSAVAGGSDNEAYGLCAAIGGGLANTAGDAVADTAATVAGGYGGGATAKFALVGGGYGNQASGVCATVGGGYCDTAMGSYSTIAGGYQNSAAEIYATVGGGTGNSATGSHATVAGGYANTASGGVATVGGGQNHEAETSYTTIGGGFSNRARGYAATVGGGYLNAANGRCATVPGGYHSRAVGSNSFAAGMYARANHAGTFVWNDSGDARDSLCTTGSNQWLVSAKGGAWFYSNIARTSGAYLAPGSNAWASACDSATKEDFRPVDRQELLDKVAALRVRNYKMRDQDDGTRHIGPVAQDFAAAFGVGENNTSINLADADGVLLAAVQALYEQNQELAQRVAELEAGRTER